LTQAADKRPGFSVQSPKGTHDILPAQARRWRGVERVVQAVMQRFGYEEIRTPIFEEAALFIRGVGEHTDVVSKEIYTFGGKGADHVNFALRPECTAGVVRAYVQHRLYREPAPQKFWYMGPMFRYERPQAGRQRQFHQLGVECFASDNPLSDAEAILMAVDLLAELGLTTLTVALNSVGCPNCRPAYRLQLVRYLEEQQASLCATCLTRKDTNPLRVLDCKAPGCQPIVACAPALHDFWCVGCRAHLEAVMDYLDSVAVAYRLDPRLVRGLDYYTGPVFEIASDALGAQNTLVGGGRYDQLVEQLGGPPTPAFGWGLGMERLLLALDGAEAGEASLFGAVLVNPGESERRGFQLVSWLRRAGRDAEVVTGRKWDKLFKHADRLGARFAFVLGEHEVETSRFGIKNLSNREQSDLPFSHEVVMAWLNGITDA